MQIATPPLHYVIAANPAFDFSFSLQKAIDCDKLDYISPPPSPEVSPASLSASGELDDLSPLTTPDSSPDSSPASLPTTSALEPLPTDLSLLATSNLFSSPPPTTHTAPLKKTELKSNGSKKCATKLERRKARQHAIQKAWRQKKRAEERDAIDNHYVARPNAYRKHVLSAASIKSTWDASNAAVSKTAFVATRAKPRAKKQYRLDEMVGEKSKFKYRRVEWDGRYVYQNVERSILTLTQTLAQLL